MVRSQLNQLLQKLINMKTTDDVISISKSDLQYLEDKRTKLLFDHVGKISQINSNQTVFFDDEEIIQFVTNFVEKYNSASKQIELMKAILGIQEQYSNN